MRTVNQIPPACTTMPPAINSLRPKRSDSGPVATCRTPHTKGEIAAGRLRALRLRGVRIRRHFHVIHHEARRVTASARAFMELFEQAAPERRRGLGHSKRRDHPYSTATTTFPLVGILISM